MYLHKLCARKVICREKIDLENVAPPPSQYLIPAKICAYDTQVLCNCYL